MDEHSVLKLTKKLGIILYFLNILVDLPQKGDYLSFSENFHLKHFFNVDVLT